MTRPKARKDWSDLLLVSVRRDGTVPVFHQIYLQLRKLILEGTVPAGTRLPPTRGLAERLQVARSSVVSAYEQLLAEGFAAGRPGAGTYVSADLPEAPDPQEGAAAPAGAGEPRSAPTARYAALAPDPAQFGPAPFNTGRCSLDNQTLRTWRQLSMAHLRRPGPGMLGYDHPLGTLRLRHAVAEYLRAARAVRCDAAQVLITAGAQQAMDLVLRILVEPGTPVWIEDPAYPAMHAALRAAQARVVPVPVDAQGLVVSAGMAAAPDARMAYVTPSHQYPLGVVMSMTRRMELLAWARDAGAWIIEDDYDSEFRYAGRPLASLQGIDRGERVIYLGTLSKVIFPGLRLGYAVVPRALLEAMTAARFLADRQPPWLSEEVTADFIEQGHFAAHLRRMRARYRAARDLLAGTLQARAGDILEVTPPDQGMHLLARLKRHPDDISAARVARAEGVTVRPVSPLFIAAPAQPALMLGFTGHEPRMLRQGIDGLLRALR
jgi:GntR family transcriptional regulator/MocR family aminotransferase